jgi:hypothetical protein
MLQGELALRSIEVLGKLVLSAILEGELALQDRGIETGAKSIYLICGPRERRSGISNHRSTADRSLHDGLALSVLVVEFIYAKGVSL